MTYTRENYLDHLKEQRKLFLKYAKYISKQNCGISFPPGWFNIVKGIFEYIDQNGYEDVRIQQIKEKFGGMRFYYEGGDAALFKLVSEAEAKTYKICNMCGEPGEVSRDVSGSNKIRCVNHMLDQWPDLTSEDHDKITEEDAKLRRKFSPERE